jgi:predicted DNA-binding WGR domain protein
VIQTNHWTTDSGCAILLGMIAQQYQLYIERRDPDRNMARFYALSIEETLFGQARLIRRWGRIGTIGRTVQHSFDDEGKAVGLFSSYCGPKGAAAISRGSCIDRFQTL